MQTGALASLPQVTGLVCTNTPLFWVVELGFTHLCPDASLDVTLVLQ
jgi:hypothetical protein